MYEVFDIGCQWLKLLRSGNRPPGQCIFKNLAFNVQINTSPAHQQIKSLVPKTRHFILELGPLMNFKIVDLERSGRFHVGLASDVGDVVIIIR